MNRLPIASTSPLRVEIGPNRTKHQSKHEPKISNRSQFVRLFAERLLIQQRAREYSLRPEPDVPRFRHG